MALLSGEQMQTTSSTGNTTSSRYAWAEHLIWMEGGEPVALRPKERQWPGVLVMAAIAGLAFAISGWIGGTGWTRAKLLDPILLSMLLGLAVGNRVRGTSLLAGASFSVRKLLPLGIILLGARMDFLEALRIGVPGLVMSIAVVGLALVLFVFLGKWLGLDRDMALLLGIGTGICGGTAIVAVAPLLKARESHVLVCVGIVTLIGLGGMVLLPFAAAFLGLTEVQAGLLAGLTIHQTPQVIAAGFAVGEEAGQVATVAKLSRVCLLAPVAVLLGWWMSRREGGAGEKKRAWYRLIPGFAIGFLLVALARTFALFPEVSLTWGSSGLAFDSATLLKWISTFLLAAGMVGVGFQTRLSQAREVGFRPLAASVAASLFLAVVVLCAVRAFF